MILEDYYYEGSGYRPLILTDNWQVAQLNYMPELAPEALDKLDQHTFTDETFTLLEGDAVLITYCGTSGKWGLTKMKASHTYNVPMLLWHNIAMKKGSSVIITESRDAHLKGFEQQPMPEWMKQEIIQYTNKTWL